jgi:hypothetical protein
VSPTPTAPSPGRGGGHGPGASRGGSAAPGGGQLGRAACPPGQRAQGRARAAPPPRTNKAAGRARVGQRRLRDAGGWRGHSPEAGGRAWWPRAGRGGPGGSAAVAGTVRRGPGAARARLGSAAARCGNGSAGRAAALSGRGSDAAAGPFSCPAPRSAASSWSLGPRRRRRLSLGAPPASPLHQGRAEPQGPSREVRSCCRLPQLLVAIFNPPPPSPPPPPPAPPPPAGC